MVANVNFDKNFADLNGPGGSSGGDPPPLTAAGDEIQYQFSIEHQGGDDIHTLLLDDTLLGFTDLNLLDEVAAGNLLLAGDDGDGILESGETWTFTEAPDKDLFTYVLTQEDLDSNGTAEPDPSPFSNAAGQIDNAAFLTTLGVAGGELSESLETASAELTLEPEIHIEKSTNGEDADTATGPVIAVGGTATFTYEVTNTGNVALGNVVVMDDNGTPGDTGDDFAPTAVEVGGFNIGDTDMDGLLDLTETWQYTASTTVTEGQYTNIGKVTADDPAGTMVMDDDPSNHFGSNPSIDIEKSTNGEDADTATGPLIAVGGTVDWEYIVTNDGNVDLDNVVVVDDQGVTVTLDASTDVGSDGILSVGESWTYDASGTAEAGQYANLGTVTADDPGDNEVTDNDPSHYFGVDSSIDIEKSTNGEDADTATGPLVAVGGAVNWEYIVTNTGNVDLDNVVVVDDQGVTVTLDASTDVGSDGILSVGESWTYDASGTAEAGQYANLGTVTADDTLDEEVTDNDPSHYFGVDSSIDIEKSTNGEDADTATGPLVAVGGAVNWEYIVTNTGNVDLDNVVVVDDQGVTVTLDASTDVGSDGILSVGESWTYDASGTAEAGQYANLGTVTADDTLDEEVTDNDPSHYFGVDSSIDIEKSTNGEDADTATGPLVAVGGAVNYIVTNTGNVDLDNVVVVDDQGVTVTLDASTDVGSDGILSVGESWTYDASGTAEAGQYANLGTVTADDPGDNEVTDNDPSHYFGIDSDIDIIKDGAFNDENGDGFAQPGETISYAYQVTTGTGNVPISNVVVEDDAGTPGDTSDDFNPTPTEAGGFNVGDTNMDDILDVGETWLYTADVAIDQADIDAGGITNIACVEGLDPLENMVADCDPHTEILIPPPPDDPGSAMTPGFWKNHIEIFEQESGLDNDDLYEDVFGVELNSTKHVRNPDSLTVEDALGARGGGQSALLRASTAAYANSASDDLNYTYGDADTLGFGVSESFGIDPSLNPVAFADAFDFVVDMMELIDLNDDTIITTDEVVNAVQDVYDAGGASTDNFDFDDVGDVAKAFDAMNNMPHIDAGDFMV